LFSWYWIRGVRQEYAGGDIGPMPPWLILLFGAAVLATSGCALAAWMRIPAWRVLALVSAAALIAVVLGGQYAAMSSYVETLHSEGAGVRPVGLGDALRAVQGRGGLELALVAGIPALLVLGGLMGWLSPEAPRAARPEGGGAA
ncbi:MAG: hypothetical protein ACREJP_08735, partial [Candidatus Methylomirabilales bacterium]